MSPQPPAWHQHLGARTHHRLKERSGLGHACVSPRRNRASIARDMRYARIAPTVPNELPRSWRSGISSLASVASESAGGGVWQLREKHAHHGPKRAYVATKSLNRVLDIKQRIAAITQQKVRKQGHSSEFTRCFRLVSCTKHHKLINPL